MLPENPDTLLERDELAVALRRAGYPVTASTLSTKASRGGGPEFELFGRKPLYRWGPSLAWAKARLNRPTKPQTSPAELQAA